MKKLQRILEIMQLYVDMAEEALRYDDNSISIVYKKKEPIFLGPIYSNDNPDDSVISFYNLAAENEIDLGYPLGAIVYKENFKSRNSPLVLKYYFKVETDQNAYKPEGKYIVLYGRCAYGESDELYEKLFTFIEENKLRICGNPYEEYPLNELSTKDEQQYCVKIEVMIEDI